MSLLLAVVVAKTSPLPRVRRDGHFPRDHAVPSSSKCHRAVSSCRLQAAQLRVRARSGRRSAGGATCEHNWSQQVQRTHHAAQEPGRESGNAVRHRLEGGGYEQTAGACADCSPDRVSPQARLLLTRLRVAEQVGISSVWYEGNSCNMHLLDLAAAVKEGVQAAGMVRAGVAPCLHVNTPSDSTPSVCVYPGSCRPLRCASGWVPIQHHRRERRD